ncbi:MAG TPA: YceI family protein [Ilumatobacteraceae bacterium]|jgi:Tol biopolymer transport system component/polyisoprenoid-binding protein YceI
MRAIPVVRIRRSWIVACSAAVVALPLAGYGYLAWSTRDAPAKATLHPRDTSTPASTPATRVRGLNGEWKVVEASGFVGYRVREKLGPISAPSDAVGRSSAVTGSATFEHNDLRALVVDVDMTALRSDVDSRDGQMRREGLQTDRFPNAHYQLDTPLRFADPVVGKVIDVVLHGSLTLHGVTRPVDVPLQARWDGDTIQVAGSAQIHLSDFDIDISGLAWFKIDETGTFEFELTLSAAGRATPVTPSTILAQPATPTGEPEDPPCPASTSPADLPAALLFTAYTDNGPQIWIAGPGTTAPRPIIDEATDATWSPDGSKIAFGTAPRSDEPPVLAIADITGNVITTIDQPGAGQPDWSPDGTSLLFIRAREGADTTEIWQVGADGSNPHRLAGEGDDVSQPRWTPDGSRIIYTRHSQGTNDDVMIMNADGTSAKALAATNAYEYSGSIQGDNLLYVVDGRIHIAREADPSADALLTDGPNDGDPALSADGSLAAFVHQANIYLTGTDRHERSCLSVGISVAGGLRWAPADVAGFGDVVGFGKTES